MIGSDSTRREFLAGVGGLALASSLEACGRPDARDDRPNILLLLTDDQRADSVGYAGNRVVRTPEIDRLAQEGLAFRNAFVTTSICPVSRASILTGQYMRRHGIAGFSQDLPDETLALTYPALLHRSGYTTGFIGKWGIGRPPTASVYTSPTFDYWAGASAHGNYWHDAACPFVTGAKRRNTCTCPPDGPAPRTGHAGIANPVHLTTEIIPAHVANFLARSAGQKPFCLSVSFKSPHSPRSDFDPRFADLYAGAEIPIADSATPQDAERLPEFIRRSLSGRATKDPEARRNRIRDYYRLISGVDFAIGEIRRALEKHDVARNTVVIFSSDNGYLFGEHGLTGKWLMQEPSIRVPLAILDPRITAARRGIETGEMALNIDLAPTILDLAGISAPERMQGSSLVPMLTDPDGPLREDWFYEHHFRTRNYPIERTEGIRTRRWKYVRYIDQEPHYEQLFDLESDPHERWNLVEDAEHRQTLEKLRWRWLSSRRSLV